jgi:hypothetical protein
LEPRRSRGRKLRRKRFLGVSEGCTECQGVVGAGGSQSKLLDVKFERVLSRLGCQNLECRAIGKNFAESDGAELSHGIFGALATAAVALLARWNVDLQSFQLDKRNSSRRAEEAPDRCPHSHAFDRNQRRQILTALKMKRHIFGFGLHQGKRNSHGKTRELNLAVIFVRQPVLHPVARPPRNFNGHSKQRRGNCKKSTARDPEADFPS